MDHRDGNLGVLAARRRKKHKTGTGIFDRKWQVNADWELKVLAAKMRKKHKRKGPAGSESANTMLRTSDASIKKY